MNSYRRSLLPIIIIGLAVPAAPLPAQPQRSLQTTAYQASVEQEQLRAQTKRLMTSMNRMLEEFSANPAAAEEVALTKETIAKLQSLSDSEMAAVVAALRDASTTKNAAGPVGQLLAANRTAKDIQVTLSALADRLALYQDEASLELRLINLIRRQLANQRQARYLVDGTVEAADAAKQSELATVEQNAIKREIDNLLQSVRNLAFNAASPAATRTTFTTVFNTAESTQLAALSQTAAGYAASKNFQGAVDADGKVIGSLQAMLLALKEGKSPEERYRIAEQSMRRLAAKETSLAQNTTKSSPEQQHVVMRRQQDVADQRTLVSMEVARLSPETVALLEQSRTTLDSLDSTLQRERGVIGNPDRKLEVVNTQNGVAKNFTDIADLLKRRADTIAKANSSGEGGSNAERSALSNASTSVMNAIAKMNMAEQLLNQGGDTNAAKDQMGKAQGDLNKAQGELGNAPNAAPKGAGEEIKKAHDGLGKGQEQASPGGQGDRTQANASVGEAKDHANRALAELQSALNSMKSTGQLVASQSTGPLGDPTTGSGGGGGWGTFFNHNNEASPYSALATASDGDREALSMLQREKSPPEYNTMAAQYMKNLAEGALPAQQ